MNAAIAAKARKFAPIVLPLAAIAAARTMTFTDWAAANATLAALLFAWVVADGLALGLIAKAERHRPGLKALLGAFAAASLMIVLGAAAPVRAAILAMPPLLAALGVTMVAYLGWSAVRAGFAWRAERSAEAVLGSFIPRPLARAILHEFGMMHLALFRWNALRDVPAGAQAFAYHRYLNPMIAALLVLQLFELAVVHFFLMMWNPTIAWIAFGLSAAGALWLVALMKSFRINPVLLDGDRLRVRSGAIVDVVVPLDAIAGIVPAFDEATRKRKDTLDIALLAAPNVCLELAYPVAIPTMFGGSREVVRVAMRLEDSAGFIAALWQGGCQNPSV